VRCFFANRLVSKQLTFDGRHVAGAGVPSNLFSIRTSFGAARWHREAVVHQDGLGPHRYAHAVRAALPHCPHWIPDHREKDPSTLLNRDWKKSTRCAAESECIEVRLANDIVQVRDSKDTLSPSLQFSSECWARFLDLIRATTRSAARATADLQASPS
jgi:hypothetical protein